MKQVVVGVVGMGKMALLHSAVFNALEGSRVSAFAEPEKVVSGILKDLVEAPVYPDSRQKRSARGAGRMITVYIGYVRRRACPNQDPHLRSASKIRI